VSLQDDDQDGLKLQWQRRLPIALIISMVAIGLIVLLLDISGSSRPPSTATIGHPAPAFQLQSLDRNSVKLSDHLGSPVIVSFIASWCLACDGDLELLARAYERYAPKGLAILGVVHEDDQDKMRDFVAEHGASWPQLLDPTNETWRAYAAIAPPASYFIDADGVLQTVSVKPLDASTLEEHLASIGL
jgi:cytochrome c biogenesis protein CcmG/thiol:disulfide interchange protein DsbE